MVVHGLSPLEGLLVGFVFSVIKFNRDIGHIRDVATRPRKTETPAGYSHTFSLSD